MATRVIGTVIFFNPASHEGVLATPSLELTIKISGTGSIYESGEVFATRRELQIQRGGGPPIPFNRRLYVGDILLRVLEEVQPELLVQASTETAVVSQLSSLENQIPAYPPDRDLAIMAGFVRRRY